MLGRSVEGLSIEDRADPPRGVLDAFGVFKYVLLELELVLKPQACEAAFEASGRNFCVFEGLDDVVLLSPPGRKVRSILPFFLR